MNPKPADKKEDPIPLALETKPLSPGEKALYQKLLEKADRSIEEWAEAVEKIRDQRLYREDFGTFEEFCRQRLGKSRSRVYQLLEAEELKKELRADLSTMVDKTTSTDLVPRTERQARELEKIPREVRAAVMRDATEGGTIEPTTRAIRLAAEKRALPQDPQDVGDDIRRETDVYHQQLEKIAGICGKDFAKKIDDQDILTGPSDVKNFADLPPPRMRVLARFALKTGTLKDAVELESEEDLRKDLQFFIQPKDTEAGIRRELTERILQLTKDDDFVRRHGVARLCVVTDKLYGKDGLLNKASREKLEILAECDPQELVEVCLGHEGEIQSITDLIKFLIPEIEAVKVEHDDAGAESSAERSAQALRAIARIGRICGEAWEKALLKDPIKIPDKDVIAWASETDDDVLKISNLIGGQYAKGVQRAIRYLHQVVDDKTQLSELKNRALSNGGIFELKEPAFYILVKYLNPLAATVVGESVAAVMCQMAH